MKKILLAAIFVTTSACTTIPPKNPTAIDKVKTIALVGITVTQPDSDNLAKLTGIKTEGSGAISSEHVNVLHSNFTETFKSNLGWKALPMKDIKLSKVYQEDFKKTMEGWQSYISKPEEGQTQYVAPNFMDFDAARKLGVEGRKKLAVALKVDAIAFADVKVTLGGVRVMGIGSRKPKAIVAFRVFDRESENYIWREDNLQGEESEKSLGATHFIDFDYLNELAEISTKSALTQIRR